MKLAVKTNSMEEKGVVTGGSQLLSETHLP